MVEDARERTIKYIEAYDTPADITKDDDATAASIINQYENPRYPLTRVIFDPKNVDGIRSVGTPSSVALHDWKKENYAYIETVPVYLDAFTKQGITADRLCWKIQEDLRNTVETYPMLGATGYGSAVRMLPRMVPIDRRAQLSLMKCSSVRYDLEYKRSDDNYTSDVSISYGAGWEYDGLRDGVETGAGIEGIWKLTDGGNTTQTVNQYPGYLTLAITAPFVADSYTISGDPVTTDTPLNLSSTIYTKLRFRYRTYGDTTAKVILGYSTYDSAETPLTNVTNGKAVLVMAETASTTWSVVTYDIPASKTIDYVIVYACDGAGYVQVDWIEIYKADFTFPNATNILPDPTSRNINLGIPSGMVLGTQNLGADPMTLTIECDLDIETASYVWKRVADGANADKDEVFLDILHNQKDYPWQWFVWGNKSMRVALDGVPENSRDGRLTLRLQEYSESNMDDTYEERFNL